MNPIFFEALCKLNMVNTIVCTSQASKMLKHILSIQQVRNFKAVPLLFVEHDLSCSVSFLKNVVLCLGGKSDTAGKDVNKGSWSL